MDAGEVSWFCDQALMARNQILTLLDKYGEDTEAAILAAAKALGMDKAALERQARALMQQTESLDEGWFRDVSNWLRTKLLNVLKGIKYWIDDRAALACSILGVIALGSVTVSALPFLTKLVAWLYAAYLLERGGANE